MNNYLGASYQYDFLYEISKLCDVIPYGPGYPNFYKKKSLNDILKSTQKNIDLIICGHTFLSDEEGNISTLIPEINLKNSTSIPKIFILNKEYVNLKFKLDFIKENKFNLCITHHHNYKTYSEITGTKFLFLPFAINKDFFINKKYHSKKYDLFFSGILQNLNKNADQGDTRIQIMKKLFISLSDIPLFKRRKYKNLNIFWNSIPRNRILNVINQKVLLRQRLAYLDYANTMLNSKLVLNTLSPMQLVSPRYFETMASRAIVFCENSSIYKKFIDLNYLLTFNSDLNNFDDKLDEAFELSNDENYLNLMQKYVF